MAAESPNREQTTVMIDAEARLVHLVPTEDWREERPEGLFAGIRLLGPALCGRATAGLTILHPVGDRFRYQSIIGEVEACADCQAVQG